MIARALTLCMLAAAAGADDVRIDADAAELWCDDNGLLCEQIAASGNDNDTPPPACIAWRAGGRICIVSPAVLLPISTAERAP